MSQPCSLKPVACSLFPVALLALVSLAGCGGSTDPFSYVKESGKITFTDGTLIPAARIQVIFRSETPPADPKFNPPLGIAEVNVADGTYDTIMSHTHEGVVPGKHKVIVKCTDAKDRPMSTLIGTEYGDVAKTPLEADTSNPASFTFTVKKYSGPAVPTGPGMQGYGRPGIQPGYR
jgi:hypothetical protein